ncbi:DinB family protein [Oceanobacillus rekensis]|uniref:DinB family protein n=1 Tax=Oceanobacillus rekensis TaxID=937927 RepID=UPI000B42F138|nr:DinB family protein [Oceanobacillus rekensis]
MSRKQFNLTRSSLLTFIKELDEDTLDIQSNYFNNTIRWHIGHVLATNEKFLFMKSTNIPAEYVELFASGTKPADWTTEAPKLDVLFQQLEEQQNRINEFSDLFWKSNVKFKVPFGSIETHRDLLIMLSYHEAEHLGKIKAMYQVVKSK